MNKVMIVLAAGAAIAACNNHSVDSASSIRSVDSAAAAAPDTIKPAVLDSALRSDSIHRKL